MVAIQNIWDHAHYERLHTPRVRSAQEIFHQEFKCGWLLEHESKCPLKWVRLIQIIGNFIIISKQVHIFKEYLEFIICLIQEELMYQAFPQVAGACTFQRKHPHFELRRLVYQIVAVTLSIERLKRLKQIEGLILV